MESCVLELLVPYTENEAWKTPNRMMMSELKEEWCRKKWCNKKWCNSNSQQPAIRELGLREERPFGTCKAQAVFLSWIF
jgi:hypothetical protein